MLISSDFAHVVTSQMTTLFRLGSTVLAVLLFVNGGAVHAQQSIDEARNEPLGTTITVEGTVTRAYGAYVRLQDRSGPTGASAIVLRQASGSNSEAFQNDISDGTIRPGTTLEVTGTTSAFYGLVQISDGDLDSYSVQGQGDLPTPQSVTLPELIQNGEDYESELLRIEGLRFVGASGSFENGTTYAVEDGDGTRIEARVQDASETAVGGEPVPQGVFAFEGVLGQFHGEQQDANPPKEGYQLIPVRESDFQASLSFRFTRLFDIAQEGGEAGSVQVQALHTNGSEVSVTVQVGDGSTAASDTDVSGFDSPQTFTFSGSDPAPKTLTVEPVADDDAEGVERLELVLSSDAGAIASPRRFTFWILDDAAAQAPIIPGDSGSVLLNQLQHTYSGAPTLGYDAARDTLYRRVYNESGSVEGFYTGYQVSVDSEGGDASDQALEQGVNTEHIWPRSQGAEEEPARSDLHILVPARDAVNSARSNYAFGEIPDSDTDRWYFEDQSQSDAPPEADRPAWSELDNSPTAHDDRRFEPRHQVKGDVARALFYFEMAYPDRANDPFFEAQRETLLTWHRQDAVDSTEMHRTILQASHQDNTLNPFVVDSTLADRVYGSGRGQAGQVLSLEEARERGEGETVRVAAVVTRVGAEGLYLQDDSTGLFVAEPADRFGQVTQGTRLDVTGTLQYNNGLLQLIDVPDGGYDLLSQDNPLPEPVTLTLSEISAQGESYEAELVRVEEVSIEAAGDDAFQVGGTEGTYAIQDETGSLAVHLPLGSELAEQTIPAQATLQGPLGQFNGEGMGADQPDSGYRLVALGDEDLTDRLGPPSSLSATPEPDAVQLSWTRSGGSVVGYNIYRASSTFETPSEATQLNDALVEDTLFTDVDVDAGEQYVYGVTAVGSGGTETQLSDRVSARLYPETVTDTVHRAFDGSRSSEEYRLVALPGDVDRPLASTLEGSAGEDWQAYWDDGTEENFLLEFDGSQRFSFRSGRGFWLHADSLWSVEVSVPTVPLGDGAAVTISLHDGWNIISNPFGIDVPWSAVQGAHDAALQTLWAWDGSYSEAHVFASARSGSAFYFFNKQSLDSLRIPYTPVEGDKTSAPAQNDMTLSVQEENETISSIRVGTRPDARQDLDSYDQVAPPGQFAAASLYLNAPSGVDAPRSERLAREMRAPDGEGHIFDVVLEADPDSRVEFSAATIEALGEAAALVNTRTAQRYDLSSGKATVVRPKDATSSFRLLVGSSAFVDRTADDVEPDDVYLRPPAPNPIRNRARITYALPEAADVRLTVYDVLGRRVATLEEGRHAAGVHRLTWVPDRPANGVYFLRLSADDRHRTRKVVRVR